MATSDYWADFPFLDRDDIVIAPDAVLPETAMVRLLDEILDRQDWSTWEEVYPRDGGQPPIHPKVLAKVLLYGHSLGIRSSRRVEDALSFRIDFIWLAKGLQVDHSTICRFRKAHKAGLKTLFKGICKTAIVMGLARLGEVAFDGTRAKANNNRYKSRTAKSLEKRIAKLEEKFQQGLNEADFVDAHDNDRLGEGAGTAQLPEELVDLQARQAELEKALEKVRELDEQRQEQGTDPEKNPAQIPMTDSDSRIMPNKEGGFAPNYTPTATTEGQGGYILDANVTNQVNEGDEFLASLDRVEENFGEAPERVLVDAGSNDGQTLSEAEERGLDVYTPAKFEAAVPGHPAYREDPTQPVPEEKRANLPLNPQKKLDKSNWMYDEETDTMYCPMGNPMTAQGTRKTGRGKKQTESTLYGHSEKGKCWGCPLFRPCAQKREEDMTSKEKAKEAARTGPPRDRTVSRGQHAGARQRMAEKMATPEAKEIFNQRSRIAETPFGTIKAAFGLRQFLLRGLENVRLEWLWACTSFNVLKLVRDIGRLRAELEELMEIEE